MKSVFRVLIATTIGLMVVAGCGEPGTSDGFKPPPEESKADIQKQIDRVNADTTIPAGQKGMVISNLQKKLANAK